MHHGPAQDDVEMDDMAASAHTLVSSKKNVHARPSSSLSPESATSTAGRPGKKRSKQNASFSPHGEADLDTDGANVPGVFEEDFAMHEAASASPEAPPVFPGPEAAPQSIDDFRVRNGSSWAGLDGGFVPSSNSGASSDSEAYSAILSVCTKANERIRGNIRNCWANRIWPEDQVCCLTCKTWNFTNVNARTNSADPTSKVICSPCHTLAKNPCCRLYKNDDSSGWFYGFLPVPANLRSGLTPGQLRYWVVAKAPKVKKTPNVATSGKSGKGGKGGKKGGNGKSAGSGPTMNLRPRATVPSAA